MSKKSIVLAVLLSLTIMHIAWIWYGERAEVGRGLDDPSSDPALRLSEHSKADIRICKIENLFIDYFAQQALASNKRDQVEEARCRKDLQEAVRLLEEDLSDCPTTLLYLYHWARKQLDPNYIISFKSPLDTAGYEYVINYPALGEALQRCQLHRHGQELACSPVLFHMATGLYSDIRSQFLLDILHYCFPPEKLRGLVIADVGGGTGVLGARLVLEVQESGRVILTDIDPEFIQFTTYLSKTIPAFAKLDYRLVDPRSSRIGLANNEADIITLFDIHIVGVPHSEPGRVKLLKQQALWLRNAYASLKPGGRLIVFDAEDITSPALEIEELIKQAGFKTKLDTGHFINPAPKLHPRYLVVGTK